MYVPANYIMGDIMTIPIEEKWSLQRTHKFLQDLLDRSKYKVPKSVRQEAYRCLRHYPFDIYIEEMYEERIHKWTNQMKSNT